MQLSDFKGGNLSAVIPVSQDLINRVAQEMVAHPSLEHLYVHCRDNNYLRIDLTVQKFLTISKELIVRVEEDLHFPDNPRMVLHIEDGLNLLDRALIGFLKNATPDYVDLSGTTLIIDLAAALTASGMGEHVPRIRSARLQIATERATLHTNYQI